jgi:hypothetical protein
MSNLKIFRNYRLQALDEAQRTAKVAKALQHAEDRKLQAEQAEQVAEQAAAEPNKRQPSKKQAQAAEQAQAEQALAQVRP